MAFHAFVRQAQNKLRDAGMTIDKVHVLEDHVDELTRKAKAKDTKHLALDDIPSAIILSRQEFRIVDHVEFETGTMVDAFLQAWRSSGLQRFGYLYGRYVPFPEVPLGIKALVAFIYEVRWAARHSRVAVHC